MNSQIACIHAGYQNKLLGAVSQIAYIGDLITRPAATQARLNVAFLIESVLFFINIYIFDYPDRQLSGLFSLVPTSPDN